MDEKTAKQKTMELYGSLVKKYGADDPHSSNWGNRATQYFRFKILSEIADIFGDPSLTILDYGCGTGDLLEYLMFQGYTGKYIGLDINESGINAAAQKNLVQAKFFVADQIGNHEFDYCFISGTFNDKLHDDRKLQTKLLYKTIEDSYKASRRGMAFNLISDCVQTPDPSLWHFNAAEVFEWCLKNISPWVTLRHDYRRGNFTIYLYKDRGVSF